MSTVVTGLGIVAPNGLGVEAYWAATLAGESGLARIGRFDPSGYSASVAGEVTIDPGEYLPNRILPQTDRMTRLALIAAEEALTDAGADPGELPEYAAGVVTAASAGGFEFGQKELEALWSRGGRYVSAYQSFAWFYPVNTGQISIRHAMRGPGGALVAEQAGGLDAIAKARRHVEEGTGLMVAGGVDGSLSPWSWICLIRSGTLSTATDPGRAYLPFDVDARGQVPGEGGALLVLESGDAARRDPYGTLAGYAATFDPPPGPGVEPGLRRAIVQALDRARVDPSDVDVVFADASGVGSADLAEARALATVFGPRGVPVTAPKTMTGRLAGGGAPLDVATALLGMRDGVIPPTAHVDRPAHGDLIDLVTGAPRERALGTALVVARGHGGFNSAMVVRRN
ncbi:actinorhodin polyketide putative beta-ketoacyl synthase 2 [Longispora fulva]|uniref:Act minimal PKS chain-length factor (CLF/KS beta) n=1 Tax=Longispora fulva TaxID=619741 RepID=A0A8J7GHD0_9ACTN|nr:ketosynthase chain-length factor [Longispora fulva]MBG6134204.1 act minimal PKS chain-length factor (CLF/KS beta) [Longispora fulva]GIG63096.1 actinorhodin polyketide putative beta-ketoacyl synthase 2 [Longispora fulva]